MFKQVLHLSACIFLIAATYAQAAVGGANVSLPFSWLNMIIIFIILIISLRLIAFYAGSETAVISASKERIASLAADGNAHAAIIHSLLLSPEKLLTVVLVGTNLMTTVAGQAGIILAGYVFPEQENLQKIVNTGLMTLLILIFCELLPKIIYRIKADTLALSSAHGLKISAVILSPIVFLVTRVTGFFMFKTIPADGDTNATRAIREELVYLATMGGDYANIPQDQLRMMHNVLNLESRPVKKVMVPVIDIVSIAHTATTKELFSKVEESGFTRICVFENRTDNLIGFVNILELLRSEKEETHIDSFIRREVCFEPESKHVITLLSQLHKKKYKLAFILDEYGGITGMVALEDLIEEILGEIREENDKDRSQHIHQISDRTIECNGNIEIKELISRNFISIPEGDYETIAGYVETVLQKVPQPGEVLETDEMVVVILESNIKKILKVRISKKVSATRSQLHEKKERREK